MRALVLSLLLLVPTPLAAATQEPVADPVRWLQRAIQAGPKAAAAAAVLAAILHAHGITTRLYVAAPGEVSLSARLEGADPTAGALVLLHHLDVVPPGPGWSVPPFSGAIQDGFLWGRGAIDDRSLGIAHLAAFLELASRPRPPARDVLFLAVSDEEDGGRLGTGWLLQHYPELFADAVVLTEGGSNRVVQGRVIWWGIEVAQKRPLWLRVTSVGRGGHGSRVDLYTAPKELVRALDRVLARPLQFHLSPAVERYLRAVAPYEGSRFRWLVGSAEEWIAQGELRSHLRPGMPTYFLDSLQITALRSGDDQNSVPAKASATLDIRLLPDTDGEAYLERLKHTLGEEVRMEVLLAAPPSEPSSTQTPLLRCLEQQLSPSGPVVPAFIAGTTDARYFRQRGIPAYGFSPFALSGLQMRGVHGKDERIPVEEFREGVERMVRVVTACAG